MTSDTTADSVVPETMTDTASDYSQQEQVLLDRSNNNDHQKRAHRANRAAKRAEQRSAREELKRVRAQNDIEFARLCEMMEEQNRSSANLNNIFDYEPLDLSKRDEMEIYHDQVVLRKRAAQLSEAAAKRARK